MYRRQRHTAVRYASTTGLMGTPSLIFGSEVTKGRISILRHDAWQEGTFKTQDSDVRAFGVLDPLTVTFVTTFPIPDHRVL